MILDQIMITWKNVMYDQINNHLSNHFQLRDYLFIEHVDTALRLIGCACDKNGDGALRWWEIKKPICRWVQKTISGGKVICWKTFKAMDSNGDKKIDEAEGLAALEAFLEEHEG